MDETFAERQERENRKCWERWIACGFPSQGDIPVNKYGWFEPVLRLHCPVEKLTIFDNKGYRARIEYCHLPNGNWVAASDLTCRTHGYGSACSVWDTQYETKEEAIMVELDRIEKALEDKDRKPFILQELQKQRNNCKQMDIETAFEPLTQAQFEQLALF